MELTSLPQTVVRDTDWLIIPGNNLGVIQTAPSYLSRIKHPDLSSSNVEEISDQVLNAVMNNIQYLDISNNNLKKLPNTVAFMTNLTDLRISNNPYDCNCDMTWMRDWLVQAEHVMERENIKYAMGTWKGIAGVKCLIFIHLSDNLYPFKT